MLAKQLVSAIYKERFNMNITVFRIDERLIHGQIVTAWLQYADAKQIVVVDDNAAKNYYVWLLLKISNYKY